MPIVATLNDFVQLEAGAGIKVSPVVKVLLFPFGWSTWLSLRITMDHTLEDVERLLNSVFNRKLLTSSSGGSPTTLSGFLNQVAEKIRGEVFAGALTRDGISRDMLVMTTVISKYGGSPSLTAMTNEEEGLLKALVSPGGLPSEKPLKEHVVSLLEKRKELNYLVADHLGRFTWLEKLLDPKDRNRQHLNCYHNNNFFSLLQAWQFEGMLRAASKAKNRLHVLDDLIEVARERLHNPLRKNASLIAFLRSTAVLEALALWENKPFA